jgi:hypothetical protein
MGNGIIYPITNWCIKILYYINLVEWVKKIFVKILKVWFNEISISRVAVDIFIIGKWIFLLILMKYHYESDFLTIIVWYLMWSNIYTYFYYHIWKDDSFNSTFNSPIRIRRRFITLLSSIGFSNLTFAYLYRLPYYSSFQWKQDIPKNIQSIWYSCANSLTANYEYVKPLDKTGTDLTIIQLAISFVFLTMILGNSIPSSNN